MNDALRLELIAMEREDHVVRERLAKDGSLYEGYHPEMEAVHRRNGERLAVLLDQHGWIGPHLIGEDGAHAALKIVMHAIGMPTLQRRCLRLQQEARARGEIPEGPVAFLDDRIRVFEGRLQRYGHTVRVRRRRQHDPRANRGRGKCERAASGYRPRHY